MKTIKDFYSSQEIFREWRHKNLNICSCYYQVTDFKSGIIIEKWRILANDIEEVILVEIYPDGNGFQIYNMK